MCTTSLCASWPTSVQIEVKGRVLGIDYGRKRVGIAIADPLQMFAQPYGTFAPSDAVRKLEEIQASEGIRTLVIGWPLTPDGEEGEAVAEVMEFVARLKRRLRGVEIVTWDERYTSEMAKEMILGVTTRRKQRRDRGRVDRAAAALILQEYLDSRSTSVAE